MPRPFMCTCQALLGVEGPATHRNRGLPPSCSPHASSSQNPWGTVAQAAQLSSRGKVCPTTLNPRQWVFRQLLNVRRSEKDISGRKQEHIGEVERVPGTWCVMYKVRRGPSFWEHCPFPRCPPHAAPAHGGSVETTILTEHPAPGLPHSGHWHSVQPRSPRIRPEDGEAQDGSKKPEEEEENSQEVRGQVRPAPATLPGGNQVPSPSSSRLGRTTCSQLTASFP